MRAIPTRFFRRGGPTLSRRLATTHVIALVALVSVVLASVFWMSAQHDRLAQAAARKMVQSGLETIGNKLESMVLDYSIWTEAHDAIHERDVDWLFTSIGSGAAVTGARDFILLTDPQSGFTIAWANGSPPGGEAGLIPEGVLGEVLGLVAPSQAGDGVARSTFSRIGDSVWAFSVTHVVETDGRAASGDGAAPLQVHGLRIDGAMLQATIGDRFLLEGMAIVPPEAAGSAGIELRDSAGAAVARVVWTPPSPGGEILQRIALPLGLALTLAVVAGLGLSVFAVHSARQLEHALERARAGERAKGEFVANISHELRTPMNGVIGLGQLLRATPLTDKQGSMLDILLNSAAHQMRLIEELLEISEIETGNRRAEAERFDMTRVVRESLEMVRAEATRKGLELRDRVEPGIPAAVIGDEKTVRQILINLLNNAVKFTDEGHVTVHLAVERRDGQALCRVRVEDTGVGIAPEHLPRIFDRFYQGDMSTKRQKGGTGLGLSISRSLAELIGGRLEVESTPGDGACFTFEVRFDLPASGTGALEQAA